MRKKDSWFVVKLRKLGACPEAVLYARKHRTFSAAWNNCKSAAWLKWLVVKLRIVRWPAHKGTQENCPRCKWENMHAVGARRRFSAERVAKALRKV